MDNIKFSQNKDQDKLILSYLDSDRDFLAFCTLNKYTQKLCEEDKVWEDRVFKKYNQYSPSKTPEETWKEYYLNLYRAINRNVGPTFLKALKENRRDILLILLDKNPDGIKKWLDTPKHKVEIEFNHNHDININLIIFGKDIKDFINEFNLPVEQKFLTEKIKTAVQNDDPIELMKIALDNDFEIVKVDLKKKLISLFN